MSDIFIAKLVRLCSLSLIVFSLLIFLCISFYDISISSPKQKPFEIICSANNESRFNNETCNDTLKPDYFTFLYILSGFGIVFHVPLMVSAEQVRTGNMPKRLFSMDLGIVYAWITYILSVVIYCLGVFRMVYKTMSTEFLFVILILCITSHILFSYGLQDFSRRKRSMYDISLHNEIFDIFFVNKKVIMALRLNIVSFTWLVWYDLLLTKENESGYNFATIVLPQISCVGFFVSSLIMHFAVVSKSYESLQKRVFRGILSSTSSYTYTVLSGFGWIIILSQWLSLRALIESNSFSRPGVLTSFGFCGLFSMFLLLLANVNYKTLQQEASSLSYLKRGVFMMNILITYLTIYVIRNQSVIWPTILLRVMLLVSQVGNLFAFVEQVRNNREKYLKYVVHTASVLCFICYLIGSFLRYGALTVLPYGGLSYLLFSIAVLIEKSHLKMIPSVPRDNLSLKDSYFAVLRIFYPTFWFFSIYFYCVNYRQSQVSFFLASLLYSILAAGIMHYTFVPREYLFAPFQGSPGFILLQSFGWTIFGFSFFLKLLSLEHIWIAQTITEIIAILILRCSYTFKFDIVSAPAPKQRWKQEDLDELNGLMMSVRSVECKNSIAAISRLVEANQAVDIQSLLKSTSNTRKLRVGIHLLMHTVVTEIALVAFVFSFTASSLTTWRPLLLFTILTTTLNLVLALTSTARLIYSDFRATDISTGGITYNVLKALSLLCLITAYFVAYFVIFISSENYMAETVFEHSLPFILALCFVANILFLFSLLAFDNEAKTRVFSAFNYSHVKLLLTDELVLIGVIILMTVVFDICVIRLEFSSDNPIVLGLLGGFTGYFSFYWTFRLFCSKSLIRISELSEMTYYLMFLTSIIWGFTINFAFFIMAKNLFLHVFTVNSFQLSTSVFGVTNIFAHSMVSRTDTVGSKVFVQILAFIGFSSSFMFLFFFKNVFLRCLRYFLDVICSSLILRAKRMDHFYSPDGKQALENVFVKRGIRYMDDDKFDEITCTMDQVLPLSVKKCTAKSIVPVVFFHGGGHICVNKEILLHSITPLAREGFPVYNVEYPLAPEHRFPIPVLTSIRAVLNISEMHCINCCVPPSSDTSKFLEVEADNREDIASCCALCQSKLGVQAVHILGDSAGGNVAAMCTLALSNFKILKALLDIVSIQEFQDLRKLSEGDLPKVKCLITIYGLLGKNVKTDSSISSSFKQFALNFILNLYENTPKKSTLTDYQVEEITHFAESSLLICGKNDPLLITNRSAFKLLNSKFDVTLKEYPGNHAFHGWPIRWAKYFGYDWRENAFQATVDIIAFLKDGNENLTTSPVPPSIEGFDYLILFVAPLLLLTIIFFTLLYLVFGFLVTRVFFTVLSFISPH